MCPSSVDGVKTKLPNYRLSHATKTAYLNGVLANPSIADSVVIKYFRTSVLNTTVVLDLSK